MVNFREGLVLVCLNLAHGGELVANLAELAAMWEDGDGVGHLSLRNGQVFDLADLAEARRIIRAEKERLDG